MVAARGAMDWFATRRVFAWVVVAVVAALVGSPPALASATTALTGVDLSSYVRVGRYDLPEPTRTPAPPTACWPRRPRR
jgi:hypothetical protein